MDNSKIDGLIVKLIENSISEKEANILKEWLQNEDNATYFNEFIEINHLINSKTKFDHRRPLLEIKEEIDNRKTKKIPAIFKYAIAASILALISISFFLTTNNNDPIDAPSTITNTIEIGTDKAILTLADGSNIELKKGAAYSDSNVTVENEKLMYTKQEREKSVSEMEYNFLTVPRGGQFFVQLSDGTQVWLNSESRLKYPTGFVDGQARNVELLYGEAYFDVSPSSKHEGSVFKVHTGMQEIEVLGTEFNIKAYEDENYIYTTLIEGKVTVDNTIKKEILHPGKQSVLNVETRDIQIAEVDVHSEIAWKRGLFNFKNKSLKEIMKVLSRWYDVEVVFVNKELEKIAFKGVLRKNQNIEEILSLIKTTNFITDYEIQDKKILIK
ncbi:FecR family protein [Allomuricauda sp. SCSIO 65647]|uniref:FecR family protein n=1 Tax=Allomuricauda sp. SCSIO 65647 TaxID=2908843 RepID=UPI001F2FE002|nr:FecR domain-containing protein [Muricauda sp. SCSIO 65647]UJH67043.1 DUF4974 domain-containing protein [Muricauda sp. SCSIO 65647]